MVKIFCIALICVLSATYVVGQDEAEVEQEITDAIEEPEETDEGEKPADEEGGQKEEEGGQKEDDGGSKEGGEGRKRGGGKPRGGDTRMSPKCMEYINKTGTVMKTYLEENAPVCYTDKIKPMMDAANNTSDRKQMRKMWKDMPKEDRKIIADCWSGIADAVMAKVGEAAPENCKLYGKMWKRGNMSGRGRGRGRGGRRGGGRGGGGRGGGGRGGGGGEGGGEDNQQ